MSAKRKQLGVGLALVVLVLPNLVAVGDLSMPGRRMLGIFGAAIVLWITEAIPLYATAMLIIFSEILLISDEALFSLPADFEAPTYKSIYATLADPVLMLFLGGFFLADAAAKFRLDRNLAGIVLRPFSKSPAALVGGLMLITAVLSMFMSNTATTATMMAVVVPVLLTLDAGDPLRKSMVLGIPVAANIGGLGSPVGTPPNAIALGQLSAASGQRIDFLSWMMMAVPFVIVLLVIAWFALVRMFPSTTTNLDVRIGGAFDRSVPAWIVYVTFGGTILLWLTEPIHGISANVVGFLPVAVLLGTGVFGVDDIRALDWHVLWLVGGGIALGNGVAATALDEWLIGLVSWSSLPRLLLIAGLVVVAVSVSTVISHSATANLIAPIGITLAASGAVDLSPGLATMIIAVACSLAMILPISTPPNAIAHATGMIEVKDMAKIGVIVGVTGILLVVFVAPPFWEALGVLP